MTRNERSNLTRGRESHARLRTLHPPSIATSPCRVALLIRRRMGYSQAGVGAAAGRFHDQLKVTTQLPGRESRRDRLADHRAAGAASSGRFLAVADHLDQLVGRQPDFAAVRSQPRHRRRHAGRAAAINAAAGVLPRTLALSAVYAKVNPADAPSHDLALSRTRSSMRAMKRHRRYDPAQRLSQISGVRAGGRFCWAEGSRRCGAGRSGRRLAAYASRGRICATHCRSQRVGPKGSPRRRAAILHHRRNDQIAAADSIKSRYIA